MAKFLFFYNKKSQAIDLTCFASTYKHNSLIQTSWFIMHVNYISNNSSSFIKIDNQLYNALIIKYNSLYKIQHT